MKRGAPKITSWVQWGLGGVSSLPPLRSPRALFRGGPVLSTLRPFPQTQHLPRHQRGHAVSCHGLLRVSWSRENNE